MKNNGDLGLSHRNSGISSLGITAPIISAVILQFEQGSYKKCNH